MGKKNKIGRQRKDRFYHLAKETGFRSRAAFKLIQLDRKFKFLERTKVLIDLCAAPGGWMQVAKQNMPVSSVVIGVDMYPMKSVPGCISLLEDITTDKCRVSLKKELKTWKADVILHDGAPNLGKNWLHDAYNQNCLTLSALKLATMFLREGGWFVSKVFRSKDYNCLLWVFKQLFKKVHATKPQASRNESAEIFVVCQGYLAPAKIDPRFLNANYVFKELDVQAPITVQNLLKSAESIKKSKAEGYPDDTTILYTKLPASLFMSSDNPAAVLQNAYEITIDDDEILNHPKTTDEIKRCCEDIKVLGKKELRMILSWWSAFREDKKKEKEEEKEKDSETQPVNDCKKSANADNLSDEEKELDEISKQIDEMMDGERREAKRKRKKVNKERTKLQLKMSLNMRHKEDLGPTEECDMDIFQLSQITSKKELAKISEQKPDVVAESDDEEEKVRKPKKMKYDVEQSYLDDSGIFYRSVESASEESDSEIESDVEGLGLNEERKQMNDKNKKEKVVKRVRFREPEVSEEDDAGETEASHPLFTDLDYRDVRDKRLSKAQLWFDKDVFKNVEVEEDEDFELDKMSSVFRGMGGKIIGDDSKSYNEEIQRVIKTNDDNEDSEDSDSDDEKGDVSLNKHKSKKLKSKNNKNDDTASENTKINEWDVEVNTTSEKKRKKKERKTLDAEGLALGSLMVNSKKSKRDIIDSGWNRYAFNDEDLPEWFVEDEKKHMRKDILVPKELVDEYTKNREELNVRPIKKVAEAKARKKKRAARRLEKLKKKLEGVMENPDATEAEKARQARQMYKKLKQNKPEVKYIVAKKHTAAKRVRRPRGLKGPYKVVDPRMKKDLRAKVNMEMKNKSKKSVNKIKKLYKGKKGKS